MITMNFFAGTLAGEISFAAVLVKMYPTKTGNGLQKPWTSKRMMRGKKGLAGCQRDLLRVRGGFHEYP
jgi:hypothetical protein